MGFLDRLEAIAEADVAGLRKAAESYGDSWKRRGGVGAFMMLARKWDRLENRVRKMIPRPPLETKRVGEPVPTHILPYDVFGHAEADPRSEGVMDDIRDLRRYLMLVEAELNERGVNPIHRDNDTLFEAPKGVRKDQSHLAYVEESTHGVRPSLGVRWPGTNARRRWDPEEREAWERCEHQWFDASPDIDVLRCSACAVVWSKRYGDAPGRSVPPGHVVDGGVIIRVRQHDHPADRSAT